MEAKLEEQYQVFGLSIGIGGEPSMEVQTARHGKEGRESRRKMICVDISVF